MPILLNLFSSEVPFTVSVLITLCNYTTVTIYKSVLAIFISPTNPKVVAVVGIAFSNILLT